MKRDTDQTTKQFPATPVEVEDAIRRRAYESYEQRGRADGFELDDWAQAEVKYWVPGKCHFFMSWLGNALEVLSPARQHTRQWRAS